MGALLKVITDVECDLYIDYQFREHLYVGSMAKLEIRKGGYLLEFKIGGIVIHKEKYHIESNFEESLFDFRFIESNQSRLILYESDEETCTASVELENDTWSVVVSPCSPTNKPNIKEDAFDQPILLHCCSEEGKGMILFKDAITTIGDWAFAGCSNIKSIIIPNSISTIGIGAFARCFGIEKFIVPSSLVSVGKCAFLHCKTLFYGKFASQDHYCLVVDGVLKAFSGRDCVEYIIPEQVVRLEDFVFSDCDLLRKVILPNNLTIIGSRAFSCCNRLNSIILPEMIELVESNAFYGSNTIEIYCKAVTPPKLNGPLPRNVKRIIVPIGSKKFYNEELIWRNNAYMIFESEII